MLDVHPPHEAAHSWKDFFIHVGTICVGLLIAIGLEQTVEYFHHRSELHELEHDLIAEANNNLEIIKLDYQYFDGIGPVLTALRSDAADRFAHPTANRPPVEITPLFADAHLYFPDAPVWNTAKEAGLVVLLPRHQSAAYDLVYTQQASMTNAYHHYYESRAALSNFCLRFTAAPGHTPDLAHLTAEDLREYSTLLAAVQGELDRFRYRTDLARDVTQSAAQGDFDDYAVFEHIGISRRH